MKTFAVIKKKLGFTLTEALIVTIIVGVAAAFTIPVYNKSLEKSYSRQATVNVQAITAAAEMYKARHNRYGPDGTELTSLYSINTLLGMNLSDDYFNYYYSVDGTDTIIMATRNSESNHGVSYSFQRELRPGNAEPDSGTYCDPCPDWEDYHSTGDNDGGASE